MKKQFFGTAKKKEIEESNKIPKSTLIKTNAFLLCDSVVKEPEIAISCSVKKITIFGSWYGNFHT